MKVKGAPGTEAMGYFHMRIMQSPWPGGNSGSRVRSRREGNRLLHGMEDKVRYREASKYPGWLQHCSTKGTCILEDLGLSDHGLISIPWQISKLNQDFQSAALVSNL